MTFSFFTGYFYFQNFEYNKILWRFNRVYYIHLLPGNLPLARKIDSNLFTVFCFSQPLKALMMLIKTANIKNNQQPS